MQAERTVMSASISVAGGNQQLLAFGLPLLADDVLDELIFYARSVSNTDTGGSIYAYSVLASNGPPRTVAEAYNGEALLGGNDAAGTLDLRLAHQSQINVGATPSHFDYIEQRVPLGYQGSPHARFISVVLRNDGATITGTIYAKVFRKPRPG